MTFSNSHLIHKKERKNRKENVDGYQNLSGLYILFIIACTLGRLDDVDFSTTAMPENVVRLMVRKKEASSSSLLSACVCVCVSVCDVVTRH